MFDAEFRGCFKLEADPSQYVAVVQGDCNHLSGVGRGLLVGIADDVEWSVTGMVRARALADLTITFEETGEVRTVAASREASNLRLIDGERSILLPAGATCP